MVRQFIFSGGTNRQTQEQTDIVTYRTNCSRGMLLKKTTQNPLPPQKKIISSSIKSLDKFSVLVFRWERKNTTKCRRVALCYLSECTQWANMQSVGISNIWFEFQYSDSTIFYIIPTVHFVQSLKYDVFKIYCWCSWDGQIGVFCQMHMWYKEQNFIIHTQ